MASLTVYEPISGTRKQYDFGGKRLRATSSSSSYYEDEYQKPTLSSPYSETTTKRHRSLSHSSGNALDDFLESFTHSNKGLDEIITTKTQYNSSTLDDFLESITASPPPSIRIKSEYDESIPTIIKNEDTIKNDDAVIPAVIKIENTKNQEVRDDEDNSSTEEDSFSQEEDTIPTITSTPQFNSQLEEI